MANRQDRVEDVEDEDGDERGGQTLPNPIHIIELLLFASPVLGPAPATKSESTEQGSRTPPAIHSSSSGVIHTKQYHDTVVIPGNDEGASGVQKLGKRARRRKLGHMTQLG